ncbi:TetR family transcriptional regulator [Sphaerisporangium sp. TRM90804]|uniref:acyl-CoA-like ligand-binding transcription factor n=1 Tax=Sphaerisporangium sp. TRM90804 TaxID=3031113 RepID=UPI0024495BF3|nr:TetR family transcriptional regulator [Sphaerisporangium sp. TRM90804]MDH2429105.1 TetR family transcriptional regulator [Sphaerisporangium sp. TRM90804]
MSGLRERKKAQTRALIQHNALRLFREQGYETTTVTQIVTASGISESTFFRYFPTKEDVVLWDRFDPMIYEALQAQPRQTRIIPALRAAIRASLDRISDAERTEMAERIELIVSTPALRALLLDRLGEPMRALMRIVAGRTGRAATDPEVCAVVGAIIGVGLTLLLTAQEVDRDLGALLDEGLAALETGLHL